MVKRCEWHSTANSAKVAGVAFRDVRAKSKKRSSRSQNAVNSASVRLYGLPPTIASLE